MLSVVRGKAGGKRSAKRDKAKARGRYIEVVSPDSPGAAVFEVFERDLRACHISYSIGVAVALSEMDARAAFNGKPNWWANKI